MQLLLSLIKSTTANLTKQILEPPDRTKNLLRTEAVSIQIRQEILLTWL